MKKKYLLLLLCIPLLITGCKQIPKLQDGKQVVVELNGKQFSAEELFDALKEDYGTQVLVNMIDKYITEQEITDEIKKEAKEQAKSQFDLIYAYYGKNWESYLANYGFANDQELLDQIEINFQQSLVLEKYVKSDAIKEEEIQKYYDDNIYGEITVRHILIKPEVTDDMTDDEEKDAEEKALDKAKELIKQLNEAENLEEKFIELAKEHSDDTTAKEGGLIENFTNESGLVEEFWEGSLNLEIGKITKEPVETEYGYHIIYKVSQKEKPSLDLVRDKVIDKVLDELLSAENATYIYWAGLREKHGLTIHDDIIKDAYDSTMKNLQKESSK